MMRSAPQAAPAGRAAPGGRPEACLLLFSKPAVPGRVKTRLVGALTPGQAAALHEAFLADLAERLEGRSFRTVLAWALEEGEVPPSAPAGAAWTRQEGADLGARLFHALARAARRHALVAAVGSDHPDLAAERVEEAFAALADGADVALGPAEDGGYYLIALRREALAPELFSGIPWSTSAVLATTLARCRERALEVRLLPPACDVDTPDDLRRLAWKLAAGEAPACRRTAELLAAWGWLEAAP